MIMDAGMVRMRYQETTVHLGSLAEIAGLFQDIRQVVIAIGKTGLQLQYPPIAGLRFIQPAGFIQDDAQAIVGLGIGWCNADCRTQAGLGLVMAFQCGQRDAEVSMRFGIAGQQLDGFQHRRQCLLKAALLP